MEVASVLAQKNIETTLIIREDRVSSRVFTPAMSDFFERYYASHGVQLLKRESVSALQGKDGEVTVLLASGRKISCDMLVAGVGAAPVTELFAMTGLAIDNGIVVNEYLETNEAGITDRIRMNEARAYWGCNSAFNPHLEVRHDARRKKYSVFARYYLVG
jgi:NADPH-dependent 2,4-dienoyl-CoA reductase/sulfur reductase-like enzyme